MEYGTISKLDCKSFTIVFCDFLKLRGGGNGGAGGAIAPPTFVILLSKQPLAPPTSLSDP